MLKVQQLPLSFNPDAIVTRTESLRVLGFHSYGEYLRSDLWKGIRGVVIRKRKGKCESCGDTATQVHHRSYDLETMRGLNLKQLVAACRVCHQSIEFIDGEKTTLASANARLDRLAGAGKPQPVQQDVLPARSVSVAITERLERQERLSRRRY